MPVKFLATPFGRYTNPRRRTGLAAVCASATRAGTIASSSGSASVAPRPRRTVRRSRAFFVMNMFDPQALGVRLWALAQSRKPKALTRRLPHPERRTLHDTDDERGEAIVVLRRIAHDCTHRGSVVVLDAASQRVRQHLLGERRDEAVRAQQRFAEARHALEHRAVGRLPGG